MNAQVINLEVERERRTRNAGPTRSNWWFGLAMLAPLILLLTVLAWFLP